MKNNNLRSEGGFALILALVTITLVFTASTALVLNRQMFASFSTKHLDRTTLDLVVKSDAQEWFISMRRALQETGSLNLLVNPIISTNTLYQSQVFIAGQMTNGYSLFNPVLGSYPAYPLSLSPVSLVSLFDRTQSPITNLVVGASDPFLGTPSYASLFGVDFDREMDSGLYKLRQGSTAAETTQLRAWNSLDGQLSTTVALRVLPVSVFTLFCAQAPPDYAGGSLVPLDSSWLTSSSAPYNAHGVSSVLGVGRLYVEGMVQPTSSLVFGLPSVFTEGVTNGSGSFTFNFPDSLAGGVLRDVTPTPSDFTQGHQSLYKGMIASYGPFRLMHPDEEQDSALHWISRDFTDPSPTGLDTTLGGECSMTVQLIISSSNIPSVGFAGGFNIGGASAQAPALAAFQVNNAAKEVIFSPSALYYDNPNFVSPPNSICFHAYDQFGLPPAGWKLRVVVPDVTSLSASSSNQKLTLFCPGIPMILDGGFNAPGQDSGSMLIAPSIYVTPPLGGGVSSVNGIIVTKAADPSQPFHPYDSYTNSFVNLTGGLIIWRRLSVAPSPTLGVVISPDVGYLSGTSKLPLLVPAVSDFRVARQNMQLYTMRAVFSQGSSRYLPQGAIEFQAQASPFPSPSPSPSPTPALDLAPTPTPTPTPTPSPAPSPTPIFTTMRCDFQFTS